MGFLRPKPHGKVPQKFKVGDKVEYIGRGTIRQGIITQLYPLGVRYRTPWGEVNSSGWGAAAWTHTKEHHIKTFIQNLPQKH